MRLMDRCRTELPFYGSRRMVTWLADEGHRVNRKRVQRLMYINTHYQQVWRLSIRGLLQ